MTGADLRAARRRLGLTQVQLGELLGVPSNTIARWERGDFAIEHPTVLAWALRGVEQERNELASREVASPS